VYEVHSSGNDLLNFSTKDKFHFLRETFNDMQNKVESGGKIFITFQRFEMILNLVKNLQKFLNISITWLTVLYLLNLTFCSKQRFYSFNRINNSIGMRKTEAYLYNEVPYIGRFNTTFKPNLRTNFDF
jgi:hypothetical protein